MIALTGGAGAMGRRLCRLLCGRGDRVRVVDLPGSESRLGGLDVDFRPADVRDRTGLAAAMEGCSSVVHLAGLVLAGGNDELFRQTNVEGTANVLLAARGAGVGRFVHVSSISVEYPMGNAYSASKAAAEDLVRGSGLEWTILRPSLAWGDPSAAEHAAFVAGVLSRRILPLPGGGRARKAPVHVDDLAAAFASALDLSESVGMALPLAGPRVLTLAEMASEIRAARGVRGRVLHVPVALSRNWARWVAPILRRAGIDPLLDWQTFTGLVQDACPDIAGTRRILRWDPRPWSARP